MNLFQSLEQAAKERSLEFVIIGGFAVTEHGYPRTTLDVDLLVLREAKEGWNTLLGSLGYGLDHDGGVFRQYRCSNAGSAEMFPVDLMFVNQATFQQMTAAA